MNTMSQKLKEIVDRFTEEIKGLFDKELVSIILFGSAATKDYMPKKSDINFLVVLTEKGIAQIEAVQKYIDRWKKRSIGIPLFLTKVYIKNSLDSFPIEFLNMKSAYEVVFGEDVLKDLTINRKDLRLQCERELKGKLLLLRQEFVMTRGKSKALRQLIHSSIITFVSIFRALLYLKNQEIPETKYKILMETCREFELDGGLFSILISLRGTRVKLSQDQLGEKCRRYIAEIQKLSESIDRLKL
ncbi:nucleotidyltransferase domain-containing protein [bacterium]|nr:nucleotidyltransferase domain-containing protein [bacterium]